MLSRLAVSAYVTQTLTTLFLPQLLPSVGEGGAYLLGYITVIGENSDDASSPKQVETSASLHLSLSGGGE